MLLLASRTNSGLAIEILLKDLVKELLPDSSVSLWDFPLFLIFFNEKPKTLLNISLPKGNLTKPRKL